MGKVRVSCFGVSLDGFGAGLRQDLENPMGAGGMQLHEWVFPTRYFQQMQGQQGGATGPDNDFAERGMANIGAWILGRNMFGPVRGAWPDESWKGWWGEEPPYHTPVYVLTHHKRAPLKMAGGTTFYFVTDGAQSALEQAVAAAGEKDVRVGGGANTIRHYLLKRQIDELHLAYAPMLLGQGESLLDGIDMPALGYKRVEHLATDAALHVVLRKS